MTLVRKLKLTYTGSHDRTYLYVFNPFMYQAVMNDHERS